MREKVWAFCTRQCQTTGIPCLMQEELDTVIDRLCLACERESMDVTHVLSQPESRIAIAGPHQNQRKPYPCPYRDKTGYQCIGAYSSRDALVRHQRKLDHFVEEGLTRELRCQYVFDNGERCIRTFETTAGLTTHVNRSHPGPFAKAEKARKAGSLARKSAQPPCSQAEDVSFHETSTYPRQVETHSSERRGRTTAVARKAKEDSYPPYNDLGDDFIYERPGKGGQADLCPSEREQRAPAVRAAREDDYSAHNLGGGHLVHETSTFSRRGEFSEKEKSPTMDHALSREFYDTDGELVERSYQGCSSRNRQPMFEEDPFEAAYEKSIYRRKGRRDALPMMRPSLEYSSPSEGSGS